MMIILGCFFEFRILFCELRIIFLVGVVLFISVVFKVVDNVCFLVDVRLDYVGFCGLC